MEPQNTLYPSYTFAFQPIVDAVARTIVSQEALIRGLNQESAWQILQQVPPVNRNLFDQESRLQAIYLAMRLGLKTLLNLNFPPQGLQDSPRSILSIIEAANAAHLPVERIVLEVTEGEVINDPAQFSKLINQYRSYGLKLAIDDFGKGYSGLNLLSDFQPDQIKLDIELVRDIDRNGPRQAIVGALCQICLDLGIDVIAEGVESVDEYAWLASEGIRFFQGFLFARPAFEAFATVHYPDLP
jgi:EAL domain-containing protein (putative c-di-GMP-specific phosphodiesterase class I)